MGLFQRKIDVFGFLDFKRAQDKNYTPGVRFYTVCICSCILPCWLSLHCVLGMVFGNPYPRLLFLILKSRTMITNFFKIAFRQVRKNLVFSTISIVGLSVAIASAILLLVYIRGEWSYDRFNEDPEEIYRVVFDQYMNTGNYASTPLPVGPALETFFPEVASMTRLSTGFNSLVRSGEHTFFEDIAFVDSGFVNIFNLKYVNGDPVDALAAPNQLLISESIATKYFGDTDPLGKVLEVGSSGNFNATIKAVFQDFPQESHIRFDMAMPFSTLEKIYGKESTSLWRQMPSNYTYVRLKDMANVDNLRSKLPDFVQKNVGGELEEYEKYELNLQALLDIHLFSTYGRESDRGSLTTLYLLGLIGLLLIIIAGINYINYSIAGFSRRIKELSVRKVMGASRLSLIKQFLGETLFVVMLAGLLGMVLAEVFLPLFNQISGKNFEVAALRNGSVYLALATALPFLCLMAGLFPSFFLTGFKLSEAMKGKVSKFSIANFSRKGLVVAQFSVSIGLIVGTLVVWNQMEFIREKIRPRANEQVAVFKINSELSKRFATLSQSLLEFPGIMSVAGGSNMPSFYGDSWPVHRPGADQPIQTENYAIQGDYLNTMGYQLLAGRFLNPNSSEDVNRGFVLNRQAVRALQFSSPEEAIGEPISWGGENKKEGIIIGVIEDFYFNSLKDEVKPAIIQFAPYDWMKSQFLAVRFFPSREEGLVTHIQKTVEDIDPKWHAAVTYLDENFMEVHQKDIQLGRVFSAFACLALLISCMGLFGLVAFATVRRTKEIGIRKVLGASVLNIVELISKEFLILVLIAMIVVLPISWYGMHRWLENFVYHIPLRPWVFLQAGLVAILVAMMTIGYQSIRAALADPVNSLRDE